MKMSDLFSNIEGFDAMDAEAKVKAISELELDNGASEISKLKDALTRANSENAEWKRKSNLNKTESEKTISELAEKIKALEDINAKVVREKTISDHKASLIKQGYDEALATSSAAAIVDGDFATVLANQGKFLEAHDKQLKAEMLANTPTPPAGKGAVGVDYGALIAKAEAAGDIASVVAFTRLQAEANANTPNK